MENLKAKAITLCPICGGKTYARFFENKLTEKQ